MHSLGNETNISIGQEEFESYPKKMIVNPTLVSLAVYLQLLKRVKQPHGNIAFPGGEHKLICIKKFL